MLNPMTAVTEEASVGKRMYISDSILEQIQFPFVKGQVPSWSVPLYSLVGPPVVIAVHAKVTNRPSTLSHHGVMGSLFSTSSSALLTNILKLTVRSAASARACSFFPGMAAGTKLCMMCAPM